MTVPPCPSCDTPLTPIRADGKGYVWAGCPTCRTIHLIAPDGHIAHTGDAR